MNNSIIDWKYLKQLKNDVGTQDFTVIINCCISEIDTIITPLNERKFNSEIDIKMLLHTLKGCAINLGFIDVAAACDYGGKLARRGVIYSIDLKHITMLYAHSKLAFFKQEDHI